jgi:hypothetical protein
LVQMRFSLVLFFLSCRWGWFEHIGECHPESNDTNE